MMFQARMPMPGWRGALLREGALTLSWILREGSRASLFNWEARQEEVPACMAESETAPLFPAPQVRFLEILHRGR